MGIFLFLIAGGIISFVKWGLPLFPVSGLWILAVICFIYLVTLLDYMQTKHAILRNFPLIGHLRYGFELIRPEIQQYFIESNEGGRPISRNIRSVVYQRSKKVLQTLPYGTQRDLYSEGSEWALHSLYPKPADEGWEFFTIGNSQCKKPYRSSRLNISAMSYGSLSSVAIKALNLGAKKGGFSHNTGEGGVSPHHLMGGDLVWQIGTGYFGCRTEDGNFCEKSFVKNATRPEVKMIELKLSQGAKPGKGGMLPGKKVTEEVAKIRGVKVGQSVNSPPHHKAFSDSKGLLNFIQKLRDLSGGKPVGFKLCLGVHEEFDQVVDEIKKSGIIPDFIAVDGSEGGTGAAPIEFSNSMGTPLKEGLSYVDEALKKAGVRKEIALIASGKSFTGFDMIRNFALGANIINSARGMMLSLGCIQALQCHSNYCPVGIATNNKRLMRGLVVDQKAPRVANYHSETIHSAEMLLVAMGKRTPENISRQDIFRRDGTGKISTFADIYSL